MKQCNKCGAYLHDGNWNTSLKNKRMYTCMKCHAKNATIRRRRKGSVPMSENTKCSVWLGVYISEQLLSKVFKNVKRMPYGYSGYDFICNHGKKIDVKSGCMQIRADKGWSPVWTFVLKNNTISDYFLCLAFDNRENLNPLHAWLLPSNKFNCASASISVSTLKKWDNYKINIEDIVVKCDEIKSKNRNDNK